MKILHFGNIKTGIDSYVRNTVATASDEFDFVIVHGGDDKGKPFYRKGNLVPEYNICLYRSLNPYRDIKAIFQAIKIIRKEKPDLIHCHSAKGGVVGRFAAYFTNTKSVYTPHAFSFLSSSSKLKSRIFMALEKIARLKSYLLACSDSELKLGLEVVGFCKKKAFVWNNAISDPVSESKEDIEPLKGPYIISVGRPCYQKNPLLMVDIMNEVHKTHPNVKFYLLGVGFYSPELENMENRIADYHLEDIVKLLPYMPHEDTLQHVKNSLFYLTTSYYEGLPIAVLEAMAESRAIVASNVIGNKDCVKDNCNGYLLPMECSAFVEKINFLLDNNDELSRLSNNSRIYFEKDFLLKNRISDLEAIYTKIIKS